MTLGCPFHPCVDHVAIGTVAQGVRSIDDDDQRRTAGLLLIGIRQNDRIFGATHQHRCKHQHQTTHFGDAIHPLPILQRRDAESAFHFHLEGAATTEPRFFSNGLDGPVGLLAQQAAGVEETLLVQVIAQAVVFLVVLEEFAKAFLCQAEGLGHRLQCQFAIGIEKPLVHFIVHPGHQLLVAHVGSQLDALTVGTGLFPQQGHFVIDVMLQLLLQFIDSLYQFAFALLVLFQQSVLVFHQLCVGRNHPFPLDVQHEHRDDEGNHEHDDDGYDEQLRSGHRLVSKLKRAKIPFLLVIP